MRGFSSHPSRTVKITRGEQVVEFVVSPTPLGYTDLLVEVLPAPKAPERGAVDPKLATKHSTRHVMLILAKSLGDQLDSRPPESRTVALWEAYADAVQAEFTAAHLVEGDLSAIITEINLLNRGHGDLPKA